MTGNAGGKTLGHAIEERTPSDSTPFSPAHTPMTHRSPWPTTTKIKRLSIVVDLSSIWLALHQARHYSTGSMSTGLRHVAETAVETFVLCSSYTCMRCKIITSVKWNELYCTCMRCKIILGVLVSLVKVRGDKIRIRTPQ